MEIVQTKEHWGLSVFEVIDNDGRAIAQCWRGSSEQNLADAERIAAMWDALRGFTTAEIKTGLDLAAINLALKANKAMLAAETARADKAEQQRDELLRALEKVLPAVVECERACRKIGAVVAHEEIARALAESRELIASVKGGE